LKTKSAKSFLSNGIKALLIGQSGAGKTSTVKSLVAEGFKVLVISAESGLMSISDTEVDVIDISKDENENPIDIKERSAYLMQKVFPFIKSGKHNYDTIFVDSVTEINAIVMAYLNHKYPDPKQNMPKFGENTEVMRRIIREFRDLKYNVVLVGLSTIEKDDVGRRFIVPDVVGKIGQEIPAMFDEVFYLQVYTDDKGVSKRRIQCQPNSDITLCKDRSLKLQMYEENELGKIFKKIKHVTATK
jgi:hypothetical protein